MKKGIFFASLNSDKLIYALENKNNIKKIISSSDIFVFDVHETLNGIYFNSKNINEQKETIENTINLLDDFKEANEIENIVKYSDIKKSLKSYIKDIYNEYYSNPIFESHCHNQIFQNLQPKLRKMGINNNKSSYIELLVPFLICEIAMYLFVFDKSQYGIIYGLENEMQIIAAIKNKKYITFEKYLINLVPHYKIEI